MYTRISRTGGRQYLQLVESFRNDSDKVRTRVVANLGRLDQITPERLDPLINGLNRAVGRAGNTACEVIQEPGLGFGNVFALHELWRDLGFDTALTRALRSGRRKTDVEALVRAMVFNRLCDPTSKLGCLRWLETVAMPEIITHQQPRPGANDQPVDRIVHGVFPKARYRMHHLDAVMRLVKLPQWRRFVLKDVDPTPVAERESAESALAERAAWPAGCGNAPGQSPPKRRDREQIPARQAGPAPSERQRHRRDKAYRDR